MDNEELDDIDRGILFRLQQDARNNSNAAISNDMDVSPSTVGKRIAKLESSGIIKGYHPDIDYDKASFPLRVLFICSTSIADRTRLIKEVLDLTGIVNIKELMTGASNVHIEVVGQSNDDITRLATAIDGIGITINEEILVKNEYPQPASVFNDRSPISDR